MDFQDPPDKGQVRDPRSGHREARALQPRAVSTGHREGGAQELKVLLKTKRRAWQSHLSSAQVGVAGLGTTAQSRARAALALKGRQKGRLAVCQTP